MASLWDQLTKLLPSVLPSDPDEAINGSELLKRVSRKLDGDYAENTLRAHFSRMSAEPDSVIAKVEDGHGYYLRREEPSAVKAQLERLLPLVLPKDPAKAVNGTKLIELLAPKLEGDFKEDSLRWYFSRMAADETSVIAKVAEGHGYFLRRSPNQPSESLVAQLTVLLPKLLSPDPEKAVNGTRLIELVRPKLDGEYAENTLRAHFSRMSADASSVLAKVDDGHGYYLRKRVGSVRAGESLWDQLTRVLPTVLSPRPTQALTGTELIEKLGRVLEGDYAENTLRAHFSRMAADPDSVIAKVEEGNGYYLRKPGAPPSLQDQLVELLPAVLPREEEEAINGTELMKLVLPKVRGDFAENTLRAYFSQMASEPDSVIAKVDGGHGYFLRPIRRAVREPPKTIPQREPLSQPVVQSLKVLAAPSPQPAAAPPPSALPLAAITPGARAPSTIELPDALAARLGVDEKAVLEILRENGSARTSELASRLSRNPLRLNGLMRALRRVLHDEGVSLFTDEVLPDGETMYRYLHKESH